MAHSTIRKGCVGPRVEFRPREGGPDRRVEGVCGYGLRSGEWVRVVYLEERPDIAAVDSLVGLWADALLLAFMTIASGTGLGLLIARLRGKPR